MKKLLQIATDIFLFCFLLLILSIPVLVSFNLDPKYYPLNSPAVAGAQTPGSQEFFVKEDSVSTNRITVQNSEKDKNSYNIDFKIRRGDKLQESLKLGNLKYDSQNPKKFIVNLFSDKNECGGIYVSLTVDNQVYELFDGTDFFESEINTGNSSKVFLNISSYLPIGYDIEASLAIRAIP